MAARGRGLPRLCIVGRVHRMRLKTRFKAYPPQSQTQSLPGDQNRLKSKLPCPPGCAGRFFVLGGGGHPQLCLGRVTTCILSSHTHLHPIEV